MSKTDDKITEIWGQQFRTAKNGLDEADVSSFIGSLITQNNELSESLENVNSLMKSAENTIVEAGKQAKNVEMEIEEEARAKATALIAEAAEKARAEADTIIAEMHETAKARTASIQEEVKQLRASSRSRIESEIRERFETVCADIFPGQDDPETPMVAVVDAREADAIKEPETSPVDTTSAITPETVDRLAPAAEEGEAEDEDVPDTLLEAEAHDAPSLADEDGTSEEGMAQLAKSTTDEPEAQLAPAPDNGDEGGDDSLCQGQVELRIPPPIVLDRVLKIHREMKENPQIEVRSFAVSAEDGVKVELNLPTAMPLAQLLRSVPGVVDVAGTQDPSTNNSRRRKGGAPPVTVFQVTVS